MPATWRQLRAEATFLEADLKKELKIMCCDLAHSWTKAVSSPNTHSQ